MTRHRRPFDPARFARTTEGQLVLGFFVVLYGLGGALIWAYYGLNAALLGWLCMTVVVFFFLLLFGIVSLMGWWANR